MAPSDLCSMVFKPLTLILLSCFLVLMEASCCVVSCLEKKPV